MRILGVRFKNLNSLAGEWRVDFTHPMYESDGIFAITGPTGAGKTTILDAVCLGLYGRTPRLDRVTKSGNEIMSRQTGECFAEVTFETQKGRFRCHWSQHRARKRPEGELQQARHEIAYADTGAVLESRIIQVGELIEKVTGMDFERFTRSMLLAQGGFTAFLQASPDARAPILEQITGTEIYSHISMKVHERRAEERGKLDILQAELKGIQLLTEEEKENLRADLREKQSREEEMRARIQGLSKAVQWVETVAALAKEVHDLGEQLKTVRTEIEEFAPDGARLERSRRAAALEGDYRELEVLRGQQGVEMKELREAVILLPSKKEAMGVALGAKLAAEAALRDGRTRQQSEGDVIKKVRELDVRLEGQKRQIEGRRKAIGEDELQGKAHRERLAALEQSMGKAQEEIDAIHRYQAEHSGDKDLLASLGIIARGFERLRDLEARREKLDKDLAAAAGEKARSLAAREKLEGDYGKLRRHLEEDQEHMRRLTDELAAVLKSRDVSEWRGELEALKERERLLVETATAIEEADKGSRELQTLKDRRESLKAARDRLAEEIKAISEKKVFLEKDVGTLETNVTLLSRIRDLEDERKRLQDGSPCPLCGALDHPYARGNIPELSHAEAALKEAKAKLKVESEALVGLEKEQVRTSTAVDHGEEEIRKKGLIEIATIGKIEEFLIELHIQAGPEEREGRIGEALAAARMKSAGISRTITAAEEKERKAKAVQNAVESSRTKLDGASQALEKARSKAHTAGVEHDRLLKDSEGLNSETGTALASALGDVEPFGVTEIPLAGLDDILGELTARRNAWDEKAGKKIECEKRMGGHMAEMDKTRALLASMETGLANRKKEVRDLEAQHEALSASRRELFGEKDPDKEEKLLGDAVGKAEKACEEARDRHGLIEKETLSLGERIAALREKTENRARDLAQNERRFTERARAAGFEDEADYRSSRLDDEEREALERRANSLTEKRAALEARRKDRSEALAVEQGKELTEAPADTLRAQLTEGESTLRELQENMGAIKGSLAENEKLWEKQQERIRNIEAQKKECGRWDELHQLIGSADGKKFRNFAQGLTFEIMVAHANRQLLKMTDRYLLTRDEDQPLELNVIDNYQAGEIRSTKNLSGGEAFIVSLALALGLSRMASRNVRVDSLFLDEGFGTLDEDALETALETLGGLHQEGKLIGVISHVPALKERIGAQIQVIPQAGGLSIIEGPGCFRG